MTDDEKAAHCRVYSQLGQLTTLKELTPVGQTVSRARSQDALQVEGLVFSLESRLDLLRGMKAMEVLDLRNCAHRIGIEELDWFHEHWPNLKSIKGLQNSRDWADEEWQKKEAEVEAWIAEHPNGIGSSFKRRGE